MLLFGENKNSLSWPCGRARSDDTLDWLCPLLGRGKPERDFICVPDFADTF